MSSRVWGVFWFIVSLIFFIAGILIGLAAFKGNFNNVHIAVVLS
jgi:hypothetical protein